MVFGRLLNAVATAGLAWQIKPEMALVAELHQFASAFSINSIALLTLLIRSVDPPASG
jgi:hypothetical protein